MKFLKNYNIYNNKNVILKTDNSIISPRTRKRRPCPHSDYNLLDALQNQIHQYCGFMVAQALISNKSAQYYCDGARLWLFPWQQWWAFTVCATKLAAKKRLRPGAQWSSCDCQPFSFLLLTPSIRSAIMIRQSTGHVQLKATAVHWACAVKSNSSPLGMCS